MKTCLTKIMISAILIGQQKGRNISESARLCLSSFDEDSNGDRTPSILRIPSQKSNTQTHFLSPLLISAFNFVSNNKIMAVKGCHFSNESPLSVTTGRFYPTSLGEINRFLADRVNENSSLIELCLSKRVKCFVKFVRTGCRTYKNRFSGYLFIYHSNKTEKNRGSRLTYITAPDKVINI